MATMVQLVCSNCGRQFERKKGKRPPSKHNTYFCCRECGFEWKRKRRSLITVACTHCGAAHDRMPSEIRPDNAGTFFCSMECRRDYEQSRRVELTCDMCGEAYERSASQVGDDQKHYFCSGSCRQAWEKRDNEQAHCRQCGIDVERTASDTKSSKGRFCSMECRETWESAQWVTLKCEECGTFFDRRKAITHDRNFCSTACKALWVGRSQRGANHPNWVGGRVTYRGPNWNQQSGAARQRDGNKCQHCGITKDDLGQNLDVHHILPFRSFGYVIDENDNYKIANDLNNLITLCPICHKKAEWGQIPIQPTLL